MYEFSVFFVRCFEKELDKAVGDSLQVAEVVLLRAEFILFLCSFLTGGGIVLPVLGTEIGGSGWIWFPICNGSAEIVVL